MENTIKMRVPIVTGIASPVVVPLLIVPSVTRDVSGGASVTAAPGMAVKMLLVGGALNSCAVIVTGVAPRMTEAVLLNRAAIESIVPFRGMENAKSSRIPAG